MGGLVSKSVKGACTESGAPIATPSNTVGEPSPKQLQPEVNSPVPYVKPTYIPSTELEKRVIGELMNLNRKRLATPGMKNKAVMNRVLLNFPKMTKTFGELHNLYNETDVDNSGGLDIEEVHTLMNKLNPGIEFKVVEEIFSQSDTTTDGMINFKEFLTCLALGFLLDLIPSLHNEESCTSVVPELASEDKPTAEGGPIAEVEPATEGEPASGGEPAAERELAAEVGPTAEGEGARPAITGTPEPRDEGSTSRNSVTSKIPEIFKDKRGVRRVFEKATEMYLAFDTSCSGTITFHEMASVINGNTDKSEMTQATQDHRKQRNSLNGDKSEGPQPGCGPMTALLSRDRWAELDFDSDGFITYQEFIYTFVRWVASLANNDKLDSDEEDT